MQKLTLTVCIAGWWREVWHTGRCHVPSVALTTVRTPRGASAVDYPNHLLGLSRAFKELEAEFVRSVITVGKYGRGVGMLEEKEQWDKMLERVPDFNGPCMVGDLAGSPIS